MEKLIKDGVWTHRPNELKPVEFEYSNDAVKDNYIFKILQIPEEDRSTFERIILARFHKELDFINKNVRKLDEDLSSTEKEVSTCANIGADILDEIELIKNIPNLSKQDIKQLMDEYYAGTYPKWEFDLHQTKLENFISNTNDEYGYTNYIIGLLTTYKSL